MHDGNFVMDGMVLPDDTPMPGLAEFAAVNAPVIFDRDGEALARHATATTPGPLRVCGSSAVSRWTATADGRAAAGRPRRSSRAATVILAQPASLRQAAAEGETWLTVRAELAADEPWAPAGHVVARGSSR